MSDRSLKNKWKWSPQSQITVKLLTEAYDGDLSAAFEAGWRWYPEPTPKTKSHGHRFYPPVPLLQEIQQWANDNGNSLVQKKKSAHPDAQAACSTSLVHGFQPSYLTLMLTLS